MTDTRNYKTKFGTFSLPETVNLRLSQARLSGKALLTFNSKLSKFDFKRLIDQVKDTGIEVYWQQTTYDNRQHLAIIDEHNINLVKLLSEGIEVENSDTLFKELDDTE